MATVSGRFAHTVELIQFESGVQLSAQNIQYVSTFVADIGMGRMIANPFIDLNNNGVRESDEPPFLGIQLDVEDAYLNQVQDDGSIEHWPSGFFDQTDKDFARLFGV